MNPSFQLTDNMVDFAWVLAKVGLLRFSQSDTERVNKTVDKIERRFTNFNEIKELDGKRDRIKEETFLHENRIAMDQLPLEEINKLWLKTHRASLKKKRAKRCINRTLSSQEYYLYIFENKI